MALWEAFASSPAVASLGNSFASLFAAFEYHARTTTPAQWMVIGLCLSVIWALSIRAPR